MAGVSRAWPGGDLFAVGVFTGATEIAGHANATYARVGPDSRFYFDEPAWAGGNPRQFARTPMGGRCDFYALRRPMPQDEQADDGIAAGIAGEQPGEAGNDHDRPGV